MEDRAIVELYWQRDETALAETQQKYGNRLVGLANRILNNAEDSRESVNDTYLAAWNSMPPHRPGILLSYLSRLARQIAIDRFRKRHAGKRIGSEYCLSLTELEDCVSGTEQPVDEVELRALAAAIEAYLNTLPAESRAVFVRRYYWLDPIRVIAAQCGCGEARIKSLLHRTRSGLKIYLQKEGFIV